MLVSKRNLERALKEVQEMEGKEVKKDKNLKFKKFLIKAWDSIQDFILGLIETIVYRYIKRPVGKIIKILQYIPILWNDEDWDYYHLLRLIEVKITRMKDCLVKEDIIVKADLDKIVESINETCEHMNNYVNDYEVYDRLHPLPFKIEYKSVPSKDGNGYYIEEWNAEKGRPLNKTEQGKYRKYLMGLWKFENKEWDAIWDTIKKHGRSWWD